MVKTIERKYGNTTCIINQDSVRTDSEVKLILERLARMTVEDIQRMERNSKSLTATAV